MMATTEPLPPPLPPTSPLPAACPLNRRSGAELADRMAILARHRRGQIACIAVAALDKLGMSYDDQPPHLIAHGADVADYSRLHRILMKIIGDA